MRCLRWLCGKAHGPLRRIWYRLWGPPVFDVCGPFTEQSRRRVMQGKAYLHDRVELRCGRCGQIVSRDLSGTD